MNDNNQNNNMNPFNNNYQPNDMNQMNNNMDQMNNNMNQMNNNMDQFNNNYQPNDMNQVPNYQNNNGYYQNYNPMNKNQNNNRKTDDILRILFVSIFVVVLLAGIYIAVSILGGSSDNEETETAEKANSTSKDSLKKNIKITVEEDNNGDLIVFIKNRNSKDVNLTGSVDLFDANGNKIGDSQHFSYDPIASNEETVRPITVVYKDEYDHYEINYEVSTKYYSVNNNSDVVIMDEEKYDDEWNVGGVKFQVKNKGKDTIGTIALTVLFYQDGRIAGYSTTNVTKLGPDEVKDVEVRRSLDRNGNYFEFDSFKIFYHSYSSK